MSEKFENSFEISSLLSQHAKYCFDPLLRAGAAAPASFLAPFDFLKLFTSGCLCCLFLNSVSKFEINNAKVNNNNNKIHKQNMLN